MDWFAKLRSFRGYTRSITVLGIAQASIPFSVKAVRKRLYAGTFPPAVTARPWRCEGFGWGFYAIALTGPGGRGEKVTRPQQSVAEAGGTSDSGCFGGAIQILLVNGDLFDFLIHDFIVKGQP